MSVGKDDIEAAALPTAPPPASSVWRRVTSVVAHVTHMIRSRAKIGAIAHIMAIRVLALAGNVCSGLLTAAFLGPDGRGELAALIVGPSIIAPFCTLGLHASLVYNLRSDPEQARNYFGGALVLLTLSSLVATGVGELLLPTWLGHYNSDTIWLARWLLIIVPLGVLSYSFNSVLEVAGRFGRSNSVLYVQSLTTLAILIGLAACGWLTSHTAAVAYIVTVVPSFIYLGLQALRVTHPNLIIKTPYPQRLLRYGLRFYGVDILGVVAGYLDQVVIVFLLEPEAVGAYAVALSLSRVLTVAQGAVQQVLFPSIAARDVPSVVDMVARAVRVTTVMNGVGAAGIALVGPSLLLLMYGHRFHAAVVPFLVLLLEAVVTSAARTLAQAFSGSGRPAAVTTLELAGVVASVTAMLILVPMIGIVGAALASLLGGVVRLLVALASFHKVLGVRLPRLVIDRTDIAWVIGR
jgi:O-antigen/teichoic acid export membrane protein